MTTQAQTPAPEAERPLPKLTPEQHALMRGLREWEGRYLTFAAAGAGAETVELAQQEESDAAQAARTTFMVDTPERAAWAADKVASLRSRIEAVKQHHRLVEAGLGRELARTTSLFAPMLEQWARQNLLPGRRHVDIATARLQFQRPSVGRRLLLTTTLTDGRAVQTAIRVVLTDELAACGSLEGLDPKTVAYVPQRVITKPDAERLAAEQLEQTGETLPGFEAVPELESFRIVRLAKPPKTAGGTPAAEEED